MVFVPPGVRKGNFTNVIKIFRSSAELSWIELKKTERPTINETIEF